MTSPSQFRPKPPIALESDQWAKDYNEIKELGAKNSSKRSPQQTEDARFWLLTGPLSTHPLSRQIAIRSMRPIPQNLPSTVPFAPAWAPSSAGVAPM